MVRRSSTRRSSQQLLIQERRPKSAAHALRDARRAATGCAASESQAAGTIQQRSQPSHTLEQLGLIACGTCKNISYGAPSCGCSVPAGTSASQAAAACASPANVNDNIPADEDDSLPFSALIRSGRAPVPSAVSPHLCVTSSQQPPLSPPAALNGSTIQQTAVNSDDEDGILMTARRRKQGSTARRASLVLDEDGDADQDARPDNTDTIQQSLRRTSSDNEVDAGLLARQHSQAPESAPASQDPDIAAETLVRQLSFRSDVDPPVRRQRACQADLPTNPMVADGALDNDIEFVAGIAPAPSSRKRKRLRRPQLTTSDDDSGHTSKEHRTSPPDRLHTDSGEHPTLEVGISTRARGGRARSSRAAKQPSSHSTLQLQERIKQNQQSLVHGSSNARRGALSERDHGDHEYDEQGSSSEEDAPEPADTDGDDDLEGDLDDFIADDDEGAAPAEGTDDDDEDEVEETDKPSSSRRTPKR